MSGDGDRRQFVYDVLKRRAINFEFPPGQHLHVVALSDQLRVSNTPVREALMRLHAERLVDVVPFRGFFARQLRLRDMQELYGFLHVLLRHGLDQFAGTPGGDEGAWLDRTDFGHGVETIAVAIEDLYVHIAGCSGNSVLVETVRNLSDRTHYLRTFRINAGSAGDPAVAALRGVVAGLRKGNPSKARDALDALFAGQLRDLPDLVMRALAASMMAEYRKVPG